MLCLFCSERENLPSKSVTAPFVVPFSITLAPIIGSPFVSVTTPLTVNVCWVIVIRPVTFGRFSAGAALIGCKYATPSKRAGIAIVK